ncbi:MAG: hypothetical protein Q9169_007703, partial [Polycauliona sp. 2 TL-2023]
NPAFIKRIDDSVALLVRLLQEGRTIYGVNTGFGGSADTRSSQNEALQAALLQHHHFGVLTQADRGLPSIRSAALQSTAMPLDWVRGTMLVRSNTIARGHSAVTFHAIETVVALLRLDLTPIIPLRGSISASGDLSPLSYVAGMITANPDIYVRTPSSDIIPANEALERHGVAPIVLGPKEGLGFMNGTATSAAVASIVLYEAHHLALLSQVLTAMASEALLASADSFDPFISKIRPHRGQEEAAKNIRYLLQGSQLVRGMTTGSDNGQASGLLYQDRYALRTSPQWIGPQLEDLLLAHEQVTVELNSTTDNPLFDVPNQATHHGGNFQATSITSAMEKTRSSLQTIGKMLFAQSSELINPMLNNGLPPNLAADEPSLSFTMKGVDIGMASYMSELAFLANSVVSHVQSAEMHNQAINSLAFISARYTATAVELVSLMCASYLYAACQALDLRVLQLLFFESLEPALYTVNRQVFSPLVYDPSLDELHSIIWDHVKVTWMLTANKDSQDRYTHMVDSAVGIIVKYLLTSNVQISDSAKMALEAITEWKIAAHTIIAETFTSVRTRFFEKQSTAQFLGQGSRKLYKFVREELQVPLHRGLQDHPQPYDMFAADGSQKRTIGSNISIIYEALRSGAMHKPLIDSLGEEESSLATTSNVESNGYNGLSNGTKSARSSAMETGELGNGKILFKEFSADDEPDPLAVEAKRRHSISLGAIGSKRRRSSIAAVQGCKIQQSFVIPFPSLTMAFGRIGDTNKTTAERAQRTAMGSRDADIPLLSEFHGSDISVPTSTLHQILAKTAQHYPDRTAIVSCHQPGDLIHSVQSCRKDNDSNGYLRWSYKQLQTASETLASYLNMNGVSKGDAVVVVVDSCAEWALCFWAAARLACPFVPINPAIISRANEIHHILGSLESIGALIARDESIAKLLAGNAPAQVHRSKAKLVLGNVVGMTEWTAFNEALATKDLPTLPAIEQNMEDTALIVLTSGTTALPKGCPHSNSNVASMCERHRIIYALDDTRISCNHMPLFHLAGVMESLWAWAHGGTVVYPNKSFDARASLQAIDKEQCTDMCLVPSMLRAIVDHPALQDVDTTSLQLIKLAANDVMGSDARACSKILHANTVTNAFGMTETSCMTDIFAWREDVCKDTEPFPVGRMAPGAKARICAPDSRSPIKRGVIGELHQGGSTITDRYIGGGDDRSSFYTDKTGSWHVSGDRAIMAETGEITVLGRYKDIINRAGENISPSVMERVLNAAEGIQSCQVIGVPDEVAGEVPVAVIKTSGDVTISKDLLHERIVKELGVAFALERVLALKDLAIDDWPTTATGKVRKVDVRQLVLDHLEFESNGSSRENARESTEAALTRIWARFAGVPENQISPTTSLETMVDSVTVMRFRSQVRKELGKTFTLEELNANPTVAKQAAILDRQQGNVQGGDQIAAGADREGPPGLANVVHARGNETTFDDIRKAAQEKLDVLRLSWAEDVEEILPMYDFLQAWRTAISIIFRIAFLSTKATTKQLRSAIEATLPVHGMLRTVLVETASSGQSWMMVRSSQRWFDLMIEDAGTLSTVDELLTSDLSSTGPTNGEASRPLPLFYIKLYFIEATQSAGFAIYGDHSTFDAHSVLSLFLEDLIRALGDPGKPLPPRPTYSLFAKSYYNYRSSVPAQLSLDYHVSRLQGISQRKEGLWPLQSFTSVNGPPERHADNLILTGNITPGLTGLTNHFKINMSHLTAHKIPHSIAMKAAIAIYNTQQTGHPYAFFSNLQMARTYPFLDSKIADRLPDIMDMPGATIEAPIDNLFLDPKQPVSALLGSLHAIQLEQTTHAQYPVGDLVARLAPEDAEFLGHQIFGRQAFNYNPVMKPDPDAPVQNV